MLNRVNRHPMLDRQRRAAQEYEANRRVTVNRKMYQTTAWRVLRSNFLAEFPYCAECRKPAEVVDHIKPHNGAHELFFARWNLQPLCKRCHDRKTVRHDGGFGRDRAQPVERDDDEPFVV
jgi:5-methylcytosine-specific restriction protein A